MPVYPLNRTSSLARIADAGVEPLQLADALAYCRVTDSAEIPSVEGATGAAREYVERMTARALTAQSWVLTAEDWHHVYDCADARTIRLERTPLRTVESVKYYDAQTGILTTWDAANYHVLPGHEPGRLVRDADASWPDVAERPDGVQITFTCGYAEPADVPSDLVQAVRFLARHFYDHRALATSERVTAVPYTLECLLDSRRVGGYVA